MEHFYQNLYGCFDFQDVYRMMVEAAGHRAHFVEVGTLFGKSAVFMAVEIINSKKKIRFDVVDHFRDNKHVKEHIKRFTKSGRSQLEIFKNNTLPVKNAINIVKLPSPLATRRYRDKSLDFVYIDADHSYHAVKADVLAWRPKIKPGGFLGGHDYEEITKDSVVKAVNDLLKPQVHRRSWLVQL